MTWVDYIKNIVEILVYNNITKEYKQIILENDDVYNIISGNKIKTNGSKITYSNNTQVGNAREEIFLIRKYDENDVKTRKFYDDNISQSCDL